MIVKIRKISAKSFVFIFTAINVVSGLVLGAVFTISSLLAPAGSASGSEVGGAWAILLFPLFNGLLGLSVGSVLIVLYNLFADWFGGVEMELENS